MKIKKLLLLTALLISFSNALSINQTIKKKYPYLLLTEDYNILDEKDLAMYEGEHPRPCSLESSMRRVWPLAVFEKKFRMWQVRSIVQKHSTNSECTPKMHDKFGVNSENAGMTWISYD